MITISSHFFSQSDFTILSGVTRNHALENLRYPGVCSRNHCVHQSCVVLGVIFGKVYPGFECSNSAHAIISRNNMCNIRITSRIMIIFSVFIEAPHNDIFLSVSERLQTLHSVGFIRSFMKHKRRAESSAYVELM